ILSRLSHGVSFYIKSGSEHIMFDMGLLGRFLVRNMKSLGISPDEITKIVFSHGHSDHVGGLRLFLEKRTKKNKIPIYAHLNLTEPKRACFLGVRMWNAGYYKLDEELEKLVSYELSKQPMSITNLLSTTGEIPLEERESMQNISSIFVHKVDGKWSLDSVLDDTAMFLKTKEGLVLICGCCHSGLANTINKVEKLGGDQVVTVIGGVHLVFAKREKILKIANKLLTDYKHINLQLNHSIGERAFRALQKKLGEERVQYFPVGRKLIFEN
ncbi:MAG: MBL fold metallo-hydrolase, partial [Candidatus Heimdallarchaeota archaeon]|nr:MBL fold metallo-hydrolase [Candidatus Heimdallarchaeota archaeon]